MIHWTKKQAKDYLVNYHMINTKDKPSIEDVFHRINCIQYDPLNVVGTNPELVLQARISNFNKKMLEKALYKDRFIIDGWDKQMSIYETKYFPHFKRVREERAEASLSSTLKYLDFDTKPFIDDVYQIIKEKGPIFSSKIKVGESIKSNWFSTKPSTLAIDYLNHLGKIGINKRKNTQKEYDIIENLIHQHTYTDPFDNDDEFISWYLLRRIKSLGLMRNKNGVHTSGLHIGKTTIRNKHLKQLLKNDYIKEVTVEGIKDTLYIPSEALNYEMTVQDKVSFIAPLDNLIWDRQLVEDLFDFEYRWEVYTPKVKRKWGYYVLPILKGSDFIGRIEFEKQRGSNPLKIINVFYEENIRQTKKLESKIESALRRFRKYLGAQEE